MKPLVKKMSKLGLLKAELIVGTVIMAAAMLILPIGVMSVDVELMANPYVLGVVLIGMLMFGLVGYFIFIRPYLQYRKLPAVLAATDGEFLYIHTKKKGMIPLAELSEATVRVQLPFLLQKEFAEEIVIHLFSEMYGTVILEIPGHGTYKMHFVSHARDTADELIRFLQDVMDRD